MNRPIRSRALAAALSTAAAVLAGPATARLAAQMEMRHYGLYDDSEFAREKPVLGASAPDLRLFDLEGRPRSLALERGRTVVLIAASYT